MPVVGSFNTWETFLATRLKNGLTRQTTLPVHFSQKFLLLALRYLTASADSSGADKIKEQAKQDTKDKDEKK